MPPATGTWWPKGGRDVCDLSRIMADQHIHVQPGNNSSDQVEVSAGEDRRVMDSQMADADLFYLVNL